MAQRRFSRFVTQDRDLTATARSRANRYAPSESRGFLFVRSKKKQIRSIGRAVRKLRRLKPNPDGSSVDRFGRADSRAELLQLAQVLESAPLSAPDAFAISVWPTSRQVLTSSIDPVSEDAEARAGSRGRGISTHARYVQPDIPVDRSISPLVEHGAGALVFPAQDPAGCGPAGLSSPLIATPREERRVTRIALAARAARRLPGPARSRGSRPDPDRSTSD